MKMMNQMMGTWSAVLACALLLSACAAPNKAAMDEVGMPQVPPTVTVAEADAKLKQVAAERAAAESAYAARELVCYERFFVTNCLDKAKETRRLTLVRLRAIEAEASHFKRAESVRLRDADLARTQQDASKELAERTERAAATPKTMKVVTPEAAPAKPAGPTLAERQAQHDAAVKQQAARDAAEAPQRAAREASFARKQAEAVKRQERVARRLAEREKAAADKAARAAADAGKPPAPIGEN
ncbi:hypothetical protein [Janthinobacterium psychrotolerans]|uniref:Colicin import membrane protein n=1 Tax=Janthinobacterium psychrotolerans TaxID=1747903 RepID=A0A1A7BVI0_9BURK|nr:hypothetical protein [Janthinobacterium psychrotolerans]OBV36769.1 hypothetical protein ASR47_1001243 [Janthinobacterium psychrotolerans]